MSSQSTRLLYLRNSCLRTGPSMLIDVISSIDSTSGTSPNISLILNSTIFYPQGGGQPFSSLSCDTGEIELEDGTCYNIVSVNMRDNKHEKTRILFLLTLEIVEHIVAEEQSRAALSLLKAPNVLPIGVTMKIDAQRRLLNSRLHTAGHLLDIVLLDILSLPFTVAKAFHFPSGPHVVYNGSISFKGDKQLPGSTSLYYTRDEFLRAVEDHCNRIIAENPRSIIKHASTEDDYAMRWMLIEGFSREIPCGGTHVPHLSLLGPKMIVRKVQVKGSENTVRIGYQLE